MVCRLNPNPHLAFGQIKPKPNLVRPSAEALAQSGPNPSTSEVRSRKSHMHVWLTYFASSVCIISLLCHLNCIISLLWISRNLYVRRYFEAAANVCNDTIFRQCICVDRICPVNICARIIKL